MIFCFSEEDWSLLDPAQTGFYGEFIIGEDCGVSLPSSKTSSHPLLRLRNWGSTSDLTDHPPTLTGGHLHTVTLKALSKETLTYHYHVNQAYWLFCT